MKLAERNEALLFAALWHLLTEAAGYRAPMAVTELMEFQRGRKKDYFYICPRCGMTVEREFMAFCDRCGQQLDWNGCKKAKIVHPGKDRA